MSSNMQCPFCGEADFDAVGLKSHLHSDCEPFEATPQLSRIFGSTRRSAPDYPISLTEEEKREVIEVMISGAETFAQSVYYTQTRFESMQSALASLLDHFEVRRRE